MAYGRIGSSRGEQPVQRAPVNAQDLGRTRFVAAYVEQHPIDVIPLHLLEGAVVGRGIAHPGCPTRASAARQISRKNF